MSRTSLLIPVSFFALAAAGALLGLLVERNSATTASANSLSVSYVGHRALVEFLEDCGFDVVVNKRPMAPGTPAGSRGLAILEPDPVEYAHNKALEIARGAGGRRLVVLPKWEAWELNGNPSWAGGRTLIGMREIEGTSMARMAGGSMERLDDGASRREVEGAGDQITIEVHDLQHFVGVDPRRVLMHSKEMALLVESRNDPDLLLLSDPDALGTGGLGLSENAVFAERVFSTAFPGGAFTLDETHHGFVIRPSITSAVLGYPGIVAAIGVAFFLLMLFWAFSSDWGERGALAGVERSRLEQVRNAGRIMRCHGRHAAGLALYARNVLDALCERFHLDKSSSVEEMAAFLAARDPSLRAGADALVEALRSGRSALKEGVIVSLAVSVHGLLEGGRNGIG